MALDVVKLYISLLSEFFLFSDMAVMTPPASSSNTTPPLLPKNSNAITTAHHLMKILGEIQESVTEINGMEISNDASSSLKSLLESARWKFEDILIHAWLRGTPPPSIFYLNVQFFGRLLPLTRTAIVRCEYTLYPGILDRIDDGCIYYSIPLTNAHLSTSDHHVCIQACGWG